MSASRAEERKRIGHWERSSVCVFREVVWMGMRGILVMEESQVWFYSWRCKHPCISWIVQVWVIEGESTRALSGK
jgi:hypothetical protein